jgi:hypothetical protein
VIDLAPISRISCLPLQAHRSVFGQVALLNSSELGMRVRPSIEPPLHFLAPSPYPLNLSPHPLDILHSIDQLSPLKLSTQWLGSRMETQEEGLTFIIVIREQGVSYPMNHSTKAVVRTVTHLPHHRRAS